MGTPLIVLRLQKAVQVLVMVAPWRAWVLLTPTEFIGKIDEKTCWHVHSRAHTPPFVGEMHTESHMKPQTGASFWNKSTEQLSGSEVSDLWCAVTLAARS